MCCSFTFFVITYQFFFPSKSAQMWIFVVSFHSVFSKIPLFNSCKPVTDLLVFFVFTSFYHKFFERYFWSVNCKTRFDWLHERSWFSLSYFSTKYGLLNLRHPNVLYLEKVSWHHLSHHYCSMISGPIKCMIFYSYVIIFIIFLLEMPTRIKSAIYIVHVLLMVLLLSIFSENIRKKIISRWR